MTEQGPVERDSIPDSQWDAWAEADLQVHASASVSAFLREDASLPHWRAALVRYQQTLEAELRALRDAPGDPGGARQLRTGLLREVQARLIEQRTLHKDAHRRQQQAYKQTRRQHGEQRQQEAQAERAIRDSKEGRHLYQSIHRRSLRLLRWAARMVEEMELDREDPDWSRWMEDLEGLWALEDRYEHMVDVAIPEAEAGQVPSSHPASEPPDRSET